MRDATHEKSGETSPAMCAHYDEVGLGGFSLFEDGISGIPDPHMGLTADVDLLEPVSDDCHAILGIFNGLGFQ
jgi:hypothetical protein